MTAKPNARLHFSLLARVLARVREVVSMVYQARGAGITLGCFARFIISRKIPASASIAPKC